jgi:hypothetical protein
MGLAEHLRDGAVLERKSIPFSGNGITSTSFGTAYIILGIEVDAPCRIRFYDNQTSVNNSLEQTRSFGDTPLTTDIALIADVSMSAPGEYSIDPVLFGTPENVVTYFNITENNSTTINGNLLVYNLEDPNIQPDPENPFYTIPLKRTITFNNNSGVLTQTQGNIPKTYLMLDAIADADCRLRIYGRRSSIDNQDEIDREFHQAIMSPDLILLADMLLDNGVTTKFIPKLIGTNMQSIPFDISSISINRTAIAAVSEIYYRLEPVATVTMNILALED